MTGGIGAIAHGEVGLGLGYCSGVCESTGEGVWGWVNFGGKSSFGTVGLQSVCLLCRPMRNEGCATWDGGNSTWGGQVRVFGNVLVCVSVQEMAGGEGRVLAGRVVKGTV
nr:hypothetical protein [Tanacetum cinerariifolium]